MTLLKTAINQTAFLKAGIMGFQGSGKTFTASRIAAGLAKYLKIKNPKVAMFDTEKSSDFLVDFFQKQGVEFAVIKSRAFKDLCASMKEAETAGFHVFIVDSVTHVWNELLAAYGAKTGTKEFLRKLQPCKTEWAQFTDLFINSKMHILALGRAGYQWSFETNDETGKRELMNIGTKFKAEGEFGYESDLLLEMERLEDPKTFKDIHRCWVRKDRWDVLDGRYFDDPTFDVFLPVVQKFGGEHFGFDKSRDSTEIFESPDTSRSELQKQKEIAIEELHQELILAGLDGTSAKTKEDRTRLLIDLFATSSKTAIEQLPLEMIKEGVYKIKQRQTTVPKENEPMK